MFPNILLTTAQRLFGDSKVWIWGYWLLDVERLSIFSPPRVAAACAACATVAVAVAVTAAGVVGVEQVGGHVERCWTVAGMFRLLIKRGRDDRMPGGPETLWNPHFPVNCPYVPPNFPYALLISPMFLIIVFICPLSSPMFLPNVPYVPFTFL